MGMKILLLNIYHTGECITVPRSSQFLEKSVVDPDLQLRASFRSKHKVGPGPPPPLDPPLKIASKIHKLTKHVLGKAI